MALILINIYLYRVIQNNLLSLKRYILGHILRRFFLYEKFVRSLVFKLQEEIISTDRVGDGQEQCSWLDADALRTLTGCIHTFIKTHFFFFFLLLPFPSIALSICFSHTLNMLISLNYKLE